MIRFHQRLNQHQSTSMSVTNNITRENIGTPSYTGWAFTLPSLHLMLLLLLLLLLLLFCCKFYGFAAFCCLLLRLPAPPLPCPVRPAPAAAADGRRGSLGG
jgi:hypothetical protein